MKFSLHIKQVTPSFINQFTSCHPHPPPWPYHTSGPHCVWFLVCFISGLPPSQVFLPQSILMWCSLCLGISPLPPPFPWLTHLFVSLKVFSLGKFSPSLQVQVDFPVSYTYGITCFSFVAFITTLFKQSLVNLLKCVFLTRFLWRQSAFIHCCSDTQHNTSQTECFFFFFNKCVDLVSVLTQNSQSGWKIMWYIHCYINMDITVSKHKESNKWFCQESCEGGDSVEVAAFELGLEGGIGVQVKRKENGILSRRLGTEKTERDEKIEWVSGKAHSQCVRIEHDSREEAGKGRGLIFSARDVIFQANRDRTWNTWKFNDLFVF